MAWPGAMWFRNWTIDVHQVFEHADLGNLPRFESQVSRSALDVPPGLTRRPPDDPHELAHELLRSGVNAPPPRFPHPRNDVDQGRFVHSGAISAPSGVSHLRNDADQGDFVAPVASAPPPELPHPWNDADQVGFVRSGVDSPPPGIPHPCNDNNQGRFVRSGAIAPLPGLPQPSDDGEQQQRVCSRFSYPLVDDDRDVSLRAGASAQLPPLFHPPQADDLDEMSSTAGGDEFAPQVFVAPTETTMMIRNLPKYLTQQNLISKLDQSGFGWWYDFVYMPVNIQTHATHGFAFVNFVSPDMAEMFKEAWHMTWTFDKQKGPLDVCASSVQGLEANFKRWTKAKTRRLKDERFAPVIFLDPFGEDIA